MENTDILQQILNKLESLESGQSELKSGQTKLEAGLVKLEGGQTKLEEGLVKLEARQTKLEAGQTKLEAGQTKLEAGQTKLEAGLVKLETTVSEIQQKLHETTVIVESIPHEIHIISEQHTDIIKKLNALTESKKVNDETRSRVATLETVVKQHSSEIDQLQRKAV